ncbi:MAG: acyl carrier protein [Oscillospiraceae bacterium]|nr:acyl carrier protein [Oscillospiraceae bacterium]MDY2848215.1 acyl carrier protein [Oscillospiraceae bacterium]
MYEQIKELILNYVEVDPDAVTPDSKFIEDLGFNSFDFMSMLGELEDSLGVTVDENEIAGLSTVQDAVDYLEKLKNA